MDREQEIERYESLVETAFEAIVTIDERSVIQSANPAVESIFGYHPDELRGESLTHLMPDRLVDRYVESLQRYLDTGERHLDWEYIELTGRHKDGHEVPLAISLSEYEYGGDRFFAGIIRDNTERKRLEAQLADTVERLAASNDRLERFAYVTSHDLQEPLRMVSNYLELLERRHADDLDGDAREFIAFAVDGADRMRSMIDGLLEYSRISTREKSLKPTDVEAVLDEVLSDFRLRIEETDATITSDELPTVTADEDQLAQLLRNLLSNALTYNGEDPPRIHVGADRIDDGWRFSVTDNGIGIDPDMTDRIFEVFNRLHTHEEYPGTGIGLALCERIVERHGGRLWVESTPGEGSTFHFTIPEADGD